MIIHTKTRREAEILVNSKLGDQVKMGKLEKSRLGWASLVRRQYWQKGKVVSQIVNVHNTKLRKQSGYEVWIADSLVS